MADTRTASLKSSAFFIIDGFYLVSNVICRKFSKDLIKIKEKKTKKCRFRTTHQKKEDNKYNKYNGFRIPLHRNANAIILILIIRRKEKRVRMLISLIR